jgi:hypothetical protein
MILYHGSDVVVEQPRIFPGNRLLDFGMGFYATSNREQAERWAEKVNRRNNTEKRFLSVYDFDLEKARPSLKIIEFGSADEVWLDFIAACRQGKSVSQAYDMVIGPVANDKVYMSVRLFETGILSREETIKRLKTQKLFDQILFHTEDSLQFCHFRFFEELDGITHG